MKKSTSFFDNAAELSLLLKDELREEEKNLEVDDICDSFFDDDNDDDIMCIGDNLQEKNQNQKVAGEGDILSKARNLQHKIIQERKVAGKLGNFLQQTKDLATLTPISVKHGVLEAKEDPPNDKLEDVTITQLSDHSLLANTNCDSEKLQTREYHKKRKECKVPPDDLSVLEDTDYTYLLFSNLDLKVTSRCKKKTKPIDQDEATSECPTFESVRDARAEIIPKYSGSEISPMHTESIIPKHSESEIIPIGPPSHPNLRPPALMSKYEQAEIIPKISPSERLSKLTQSDEVPKKTAPERISKDPPSHRVPTDPPSDGVPKDPPSDGVPKDPPSDGVPKDTPSDGVPKDPPSDGVPKDPPSARISKDNSIQIMQKSQRVDEIILPEFSDEPSQGTAEKDEGSITPDDMRMTHSSTDFATSSVSSVCSTCDKEFPSSRGLNIHISKVHPPRHAKYLSAISTQDDSSCCMPSIEETTFEDNFQPVISNVFSVAPPLTTERSILEETFLSTPAADQQLQNCDLSSSKSSTKSDCLLADSTSIADINTIAPAGGNTTVKKVLAVPPTLQKKTSRPLMVKKSRFVPILPRPPQHTMLTKCDDPRKCDQSHIFITSSNSPEISSQSPADEGSLVESIPENSVGPDSTDQSQKTPEVEKTKEDANNDESLDITTLEEFIRLSDNTSSKIAPKNTSSKRKPKSKLRKPAPDLTSDRLQSLSMSNNSLQAHRSSLGNVWESSEMVNVDKNLTGNTRDIRLQAFANNEVTPAMQKNLPKDVQIEPGYLDELMKFDYFFTKDMASTEDIWTYLTSLKDFIKKAKELSAFRKTYAFFLFDEILNKRDLAPAEIVQMYKSDVKDLFIKDFDQHAFLYFEASMGFPLEMCIICLEMKKNLLFLKFLNHFVEDHVQSFTGLKFLSYTDKMKEVLQKMKKSFRYMKSFGSCLLSFNIEKQIRNFAHKAVEESEPLKKRKYRKKEKSYSKCVKKPTNVSKPDKGVAEPSLTTAKSKKRESEPKRHDCLNATPTEKSKPNKNDTTPEIDSDDEQLAIDEDHLCVDTLPSDPLCPDTLIANTLPGNLLSEDSSAVDNLIANTSPPDPLSVDTLPEDTSAVDTFIADTLPPDPHSVDTLPEDYSTEDTLIANTLPPDPLSVDTLPEDTSAVGTLLADPLDTSLVEHSIKEEQCTAQLSPLNAPTSDNSVSKGKSLKNPKHYGEKDSCKAASTKKRKNKDEIERNNKKVKSVKNEKRKRRLKERKEKKDDEVKDWYYNENDYEDEKDDGDYDEVDVKAVQKKVFEILRKAKLEMEAEEEKKREIEQLSHIIKPTKRYESKRIGVMEISPYMRVLPPPKTFNGKTYARKSALNISLLKACAKIDGKSSEQNEKVKEDYNSEKITDGQAVTKGANDAPNTELNENKSGAVVNLSFNIDSPLVTQKEINNIKWHLSIETEKTPEYLDSNQFLDNIHPMNFGLVEFNDSGSDDSIVYDLQKISEEFHHTPDTTKRKFEDTSEVTHRIKKICVRKTDSCIEISAKIVEVNGDKTDEDIEAQTDDCTVILHDSKGSNTIPNIVSDNTSNSAPSKTEKDVAPIDEPLSRKMWYTKKSVIEHSSLNLIYIFISNQCSLHDEMTSSEILEAFKMLTCVTAIDFHLLKMILRVLSNEKGKIVLERCKNFIEDYLEGSESYKRSRPYTKRKLGRLLTKLHLKKPEYTRMISCKIVLDKLCLEDIRKQGIPISAESYAILQDSCQRVSSVSDEEAMSNIIDFVTRNS